MSIKLIEAWYEGPFLRSQETPSATIFNVVAAISQLDGKQRSILSLVNHGDHRILQIGGGTDSIYVAQLLIDTDKGCYRLIRQPPLIHENRKVIVGGQSAWYRPEECCSQNDVRTVAEAFTEGRELADGLQWEKVA